MKSCRIRGRLAEVPPHKWSRRAAPCTAPPDLAKFSFTHRTRDPCPSSHRQLNATVSCSRPCDSKTTPLNHLHNNNNKDNPDRETPNPADTAKVIRGLLFYMRLCATDHAGIPLCILTPSSLASWPCQSFPTSLAVARSSCKPSIVLLAPLYFQS